MQKKSELNFQIWTIKWSHNRKLADSLRIYVSVLQSCMRMFCICHGFFSRKFQSHIRPFSHSECFQSHMRSNFIRLCDCFCRCIHFVFACASVIAYAFHVLHMRFPHICGMQPIIINPHIFGKYAHLIRVCDRFYFQNAYM